MRINTNIMALNAQNKLTTNQTGVEKSIQRLSSGLRINGAADDASGLAISEKMRAQIRGLSQAQSNAQDGISLIQTAEGALQQTTDILQRMRELVIKAQNTGVLTKEDKTSISNELSTLRDEIDRIAESTTFNGKALLNGDMGTKLDRIDMGATGIAPGAIDVSNAKANTEYTLYFDNTENKYCLSWKGEDGSTIVEKSEGTYAGTDYLSEGKVETFKKAGIILYGNNGGTYSKMRLDPDNGTPLDKIYTGGSSADFKIGANTFSQDEISISILDMSSKGLSNNIKATNIIKPGGIDSYIYTEEEAIKREKFSIDISTSEEANKTLEAIDYALDKVSTQRSKLGTAQNRMQYAVSNLSTTEENLTAAESRIRDVDMAEEMVAYTKASILNQSAMSMLAQANQQPQNILSLLQ